VRSSRAAAVHRAGRVWTRRDVAVSRGFHAADGHITIRSHAAAPVCRARAPRSRQDAATLAKRARVTSRPGSDCAESAPGNNYYGRAPLAHGSSPPAKRSSRHDAGDTPPARADQSLRQNSSRAWLAKIAASVARKKSSRA
jgi:hypothetical protein